jgi:hypothetical protein
MGNGISGNLGNLRSGIEPGAVDIDEIKKWSWTMKSNVGKYSSNKTGGYKKSIGGTREGSGSADCVWDPENPPTDQFVVGIGELLNLQTTAGQRFVVPCVIANIKVDVDLDSGDPETWSFDWEADEAWVNPDAVAGLMGPLATPTPGLPGGYAEDPQQAKEIGQRLGAWRKGMPEPEPLSEHLKAGSFPGSRMEDFKKHDEARRARREARDRRHAAPPGEKLPWHVEAAVRAQEGRGAAQGVQAPPRTRLEVPEGTDVDAIVQAVLEVLGKKGR